MLTRYFAGLVAILLPALLCACDPFGPGTPEPVNLYTAGPIKPDVYTGEYINFQVGSLGAPYPKVFWDFGGGASPATSNEPYPMMQLLAPGTYTGVVKAGGQRLDFTYTVLVQPPPEITAVELRGYTEYFPITGSIGELDLRVDMSGYPTGDLYDRALGWTAVWDYGDGITGDAYDYYPETARRLVNLGAPGTYQGHVTLTTSGGVDTFDFTYTVEPESRRP